MLPSINFFKDALPYAVTVAFSADVSKNVLLNMFSAKLSCPGKY